MNLIRAHDDSWDTIIDRRMGADGSLARQRKMSQSLSQVMGHYMRMEQRLTPQLIQSMDILQLSTQALEQRIAEELEKNVTLELAGDVSQSDRKVARKNESTNGAHSNGESERFSRLERFTREYRDDMDFNGDATFRHRGRVSGNGERDAKIDAMANTASRPEGLDEHLLNQWSLLDLDDEIRRAGEAIIYHLDDDGFLKTHLERIVENTKPPLSLTAVETALKSVQRLDPIGVAARNFKECLLLQLEALPGDNTIERRLIEDHLEDIARNRFPAVAKATGFDIGEIAAAVEVIRHALVLHPADKVVDRRVPRVYPDVVIEEDINGKGLIVRLVRGSMPELRIKKEYLEMLRAKGHGKDLREFLRKQVENANGLVEAVRFRKSRVLEVAEAIVRHQADFFEQGSPGLKILRMSDLAQELGCDPSTISRTVSEKWVDTPHGVLPLRYFFTGGTETGDGEATSWDSVKTRVAAIIEKEDPENPLSDDQIVAQLEKENISIKRRTVAKYRAQLNIPPARQRKKF